MADATPSLNEISNFDKDANLVAGSPAVVLDISSGLKGVWDAAHSKAQYDWAKYENHQKQVADWAANHQLDWAGVMQEDIPLLQKQSTAYFQKMAQDPTKLAQIGNDPEFQQLLGNMQKSKSRNTYLKTQYEYADKTPSALTDGNKKKILDFRQGGLDAPIFQFDMPKTIDLGKRISFFTDPKNGFVETTPSSQGKYIIGDGKDAYYTGLIRDQQSGKKLDLEGIKQANRAFYQSNSKDDPKSPFGTKEAADEMFANADKENKDKYTEKYGKDAAREYYVDSVVGGINKGEFEAGKVTFTPDKAFEEANKEKLEKLKAAKEKSLAELNYSWEEGDKDKGVTAFVRLTAGKVQSALATPPTVGTTTNNLYYKLDYTPSELTAFAIPSKKSQKVSEGSEESTITTSQQDIPIEISFVKDKEGKATSKPYRVVFYKKDDQTGAVKIGGDGNPLIDNEKSYNVDQETFMKKMADEYVPKTEQLSAQKDALYKLKEHNSDLSNIDLDVLTTPLRKNTGAKSTTTYSRTPQGTSITTQGKVR